MARLSSIVVAERLGKPGDYKRGIPPRLPKAPEPVKLNSSIIKKPAPQVKATSNRDDHRDESQY